MGFTSDENGSGGNGLPDITAVLTNIGVDYREYENGNEENRIVVVWEPEGDVFSTQTEILSTYGILQVKPKASIIRVGGEENGFDLEIVGDTIISGKLGYKASVWMKQLEDLGVTVPSETGNLRELIGLKAVLTQKTFSEMKGRERQEREKPFWIPVEIIPTAVEAPVEVPEEVALDPIESLHDAVLAVASGKAEMELVEWYMNSVYIGADKSIVPLFVVVGELEKGDLMKIQNGVYVRIGPPSEELEEDAPGKGISVSEP